MVREYSFNRLEFAGSLGDLGTLLPMAIAMVLVNGLDPVGVFFSIAVFYIVSGLFFGVTVPVQPMKVIGAYAIAAALEPGQILASGLLMSLFLFLISATRLIDYVKMITPTSTIRGVQGYTGIMLLSGGVKFIVGESSFQKLHSAAEPFLQIQAIGPVSISLLIGIGMGLVTFYMLDSKKMPAGLLVVAGGMVLGVLLGARPDIGLSDFSLHLPSILPFGMVSKVDLSFALLMLVLPQLPMTAGNAVLAYTDLSKQYFGQQSNFVTDSRVCFSMACANLVSFLVGGFPLCHGAGGLAAHYRFGARTAGSNLMIGGVFLLLVLLFGDKVVEVFKLLPMAVLGVLLIFAGSQLALAVMDMKTRKEWFVVFLIIGIGFATNLAVGFISGVIVAHLLRSDKLNV